MFVTLELEKDHYFKSLQIHMRENGSITLNLMQDGSEPVHSISLSSKEQQLLRNAVDFLGEFHG